MGSSALSATRAIEFGLGLRGHHAAGRAHKGFAEIGAPLGTVAVIGDRIAIGADRVIVAAEPHQHRRQHAPAAAVGRVLFQMRLDLRHQIVERLVGVGGAGARRQRKIAELRRAERQVERDRHDRQPDQRQNRGRAAQADVRLRRRTALADPPRPAGGGRFRRVRRPLRKGRSGPRRHRDRSRRVDPCRRWPRCRQPCRRAAAQRPKHGKDRRDRHQREHKPQRHQAVPGAERRLHGGADAPLYTTGGKPGN